MAILFMHYASVSMSFICIKNKENKTWITEQQ